MCKLVSIPWEESDYALVMTPRNIKQRRKNSSQGSGSSERDEDDPEERAQNLQKLNDIMIDLAALEEAQPAAHVSRLTLRLQTFLQAGFASTNVSFLLVGAC